MTRKTGMSVNKQLAEEIKRSTTYARFKDNIWEAELAEIESFSSRNKNVKCLLCVIDFFTKYARVKPLKDKTKVKQF